MSAHEKAVGPIRGDVEARDVGHCLAIYVQHTQRALTLNRTAADVFLLSTGEYAVADIVRLLASSYAVEQDVIRADVLAAIETLRAEEVFAD